MLICGNIMGGVSDERRHHWYSLSLKFSDFDELSLVVFSFQLGLAA